jgi:hypothetical protein
MNYDIKLGYAWKKPSINYYLFIVKYNYKITQNYDYTTLGCVEK